VDERYIAGLVIARACNFANNYACRTGSTASIRKLTRNIDGVAGELMGLENSLA